MDPRQLGFNYGAPVPPPYQHAVFIAAADYAEALRWVRANLPNNFPQPRSPLRQRHAALSWKLDMALRDVRHSCTYDEQRRTMQRLSTVFSFVVNAVENGLDWNIERI